MFYPFLDLIVCPNCRHSLTLLIATEEQHHEAMRMTRAKRVSPKGAGVGPLPAQSEDTELWHLLSPLATPSATDGRDREVMVTRGILVCLHCEQWYPIRKGIPELLPDHLRNWDEDRDWLTSLQADLVSAGLAQVSDRLLQHSRPPNPPEEDEGIPYKKAEMTVAQRNLAGGFFNWGMVAPFLPSLPSFSLDLLARFVTTVSRLGCGVNGTVLDLGVGFGWTTEWLVRLGYQAIGIDICRDYLLASLRRMGPYLPYLLIGDIENLPLRDECVEAVLSFDAFHHIPNRYQAMREISRVMRDGAKMVLVEPGKTHEQAAISIAVMQQHGILERGFDWKDLSNYIRGTSLEGIRHDRTDAHPHDIFTLQKSGIFEPDSRSPRGLSAELIVQPESGIATVACSPELKISIMNRGDTVWLNETPDGIGEVQLGASLFDANRTLVKEDYARVVLPRPVRPGEGIRLRCSLPPLLRQGRYVVELDMVVEGLLWFKSYAFQPLPWPLTVVGSSPQREWNGPVVAEDSRRIVPTEEAMEPDSFREKTESKNRITHPPLTQLFILAWQVMKKDGPFALGRRVWSCFQWRISKK
jgi:uncharacterized protein YbaR (Trm112 family)/2-polyprenyl-3-methyl-5-hydroxy-6-metoxy-1,4-benzoquinol methylase